MKCRKVGRMHSITNANLTKAIDFEMSRLFLVSVIAKANPTAEESTEIEGSFLCP